MTVWDLSRLRYTIRKVTGRYDTVQLPDSSDGGNVSLTSPAGIDDYINDFYLYDMPEHFRSLRLREFYTFTTVPNCGTYSVPQNIVSVDPPVYVDNYQSAWHQYPDQFYNLWPEFNFIQQNLAQTDGRGLGVPYTFTLQSTPVLQGSVVIGLTPNRDTGNSVFETFTDADQPIPLDVPSMQYFQNSAANMAVAPFNLTSNLGGTGNINYLTGDVLLLPAQVYTAGKAWSAHYRPYVASRPRDFLFYQQQIIMRPVPDSQYLIKVMSYQLPTTVISSATNSASFPAITPQGTLQGFNNGTVNSGPTNLPQFNEWWQLIAYGAALKIFIEDGEHEEFARYKGYFEEQKLLAQRKTLKQLADQRVTTAYSGFSQNSGTWPNFTYY